MGRRQRVRVHLDRRGIREILNSEAVGSALEPFAQRIAANVVAKRGVPVDVDTYRTDRIARGVTVLDPQAALWSVRDGDLIQAAAAAGLEVKAYEDARYVRYTGSGRRTMVTAGQARYYDRGSIWGG